MYIFLSLITITLIVYLKKFQNENSLLNYFKGSFVILLILLSVSEELTFRIVIPKSLSKVYNKDFFVYTAQALIDTIYGFFYSQKLFYPYLSDKDLNDPIILLDFIISYLISIFMYYSLKRTKNIYFVIFLQFLNIILLQLLTILAINFLAINS
ncbi:type II CAAX prenyl endopeptidase Rce1 family protein [Tepiditoga spiralis]|nr:CPBP family glutamic-type intramembrane protease [Tepiditoga spiralis]